VTAIQKSVIDPLVAVVKLQQGPQRVMQKRQKRLIDYARCTQIKARGDKPDKRTQEQSDQFVALNDTLKDELPKLYALTKKLVEACLSNFIEIQGRWQTVWQEKLKTVIDDNQIPSCISDIVAHFRSDFEITETLLFSLGICNGSILADSANFLSPSSTFTDEGAGASGLNATSKHRPPWLDNRYRNGSAQSDTSPSLPTPDFVKRHSGGFTFSPLLETGPGLPGSSTAALNRTRAGSTPRSPLTPELPPPNPRSYSTVIPRPGTGRSIDSMWRSGSVDAASVTRPASGSTYFSASVNIETTPPIRQSALFSSALPMDEAEQLSGAGLSMSPDRTRPSSPSSKHRVLYLAVSLFEFNIDKQAQEAGFPYLTYTSGEVSLTIFFFFFPI
jgi:hypothetical protein